MIAVRRALMIMMNAPKTVLFALRNFAKITESSVRPSVREFVMAQPTGVGVSPHIPRGVTVRTRRVREGDVFAPRVLSVALKSTSK